jgi:hypothetical protein
MHILVTMRSKNIITLLLLIVPLMMTVQTAESQTYSTVTTVITSTVTNVELSSATVGSTVATSTQLQPTLIFSGTIQIPPTHGVCGEYSVQSFTASPGTMVYGNMTANAGVNFYLLSDAAFQAWSTQVVAGGVCTPSNSLVMQQNVTAYNFSATIASAGKYDIVLHNLSHATVSANLIVNSATVTSIPVTMVLYSAMTQSSLLTLVQSSVEVQTTQATSSPDILTWLLVVLIVVIVGVIAYLKLRKPRTKQ